MKRIIFILLAALLLAVTCVLPALPVLAEGNPIAVVTLGETVEPEPTPGELPGAFTWKYLATTAGAAALAFAVVQFIKAPLDTVFHIPTRLLVYLLCLVTLLVANAFMNHGLKIETAVLCVFNALISAYSAYGLYEVWIRKKERDTE